VKRARRLAAGAFVGAALASTAASADPCKHFSYGMATGPVVAPILDGGLGRAYRVCGRSEVAIRGGGVLMVDIPNFYGRVSAGATIEGSWAPNKITEIFAGIEAVRYDTVIQSLSASNIGLGHSFLGGSIRAVTSDRATIAFNSKLVLPTATGLYQEARPFGFDMGVAGQFAATPKVHLRGQVGLLASAVASRAGPGLRMGASLTAGAEFLPVRRFGVAIDFHSVVGYATNTDLYAAAAALRFSNLKRFGFELAGMLPLARKNHEWAQAVVMLRASVRLGAISGPSPSRAPRGR